MRPIASYLLSALLLFSSIIVPQNAFAQDIPPAQRFTVTPAPYTGVVYDANAPSDGLIMVCGPDHLCGYLDMDGKTAIGFGFSYAGSFVDGSRQRVYRTASLAISTVQAPLPLTPALMKRANFRVDLRSYGRATRPALLIKPGNLPTL